jgi:hypothetical protein
MHHVSGFSSNPKNHEMQHIQNYDVTDITTVN